MRNISYTAEQTRNREDLMIEATHEQAVLPTIWKFNQTLKTLRMSRTKIERLLANPDSGFPKPFWIGSERYFLADAVRSWMLARIAEQEVADRHAAI